MRLLLLAICAMASIICAVVCVLAYKRKKIRDMKSERRYGGPVPSFLVKFVAKLKQTTEDNADAIKKGGGEK